MPRKPVRQEVCRRTGRLLAHHIDRLIILCTVILHPVGLVNRQVFPGDCSYASKSTMKNQLLLEFYRLYHNPRRVVGSFFLFDAVLYYEEMHLNHLI